MVVVHELIHLVVHPMSGRSPNSIVGAGGPTTGVYAHYAGEMTRNRFVAILLMPLVIISFVPLLVAAVAQVSSGWIAFISAFNAFLACGDILRAGLVLSQIPATAIVRQQEALPERVANARPISAVPPDPRDRTREIEKEAQKAEYREPARPFADRASAFHMQILHVDSSTQFAPDCAPVSFCESVPACYDSRR